MKAISIALVAGVVGCAFVQPVSAAVAVTFKEKVLYSFCSQQNCADGANPGSNLIDLNGMLYGTTYLGGSTGCGGEGCGTVFSIDPNSGAEKVLYSFPGGTDGALPSAGLIDVNGVLYGTTYQGGLTGCGGNFGCGTVFSVDPNTGVEKVLYSFCSQGGAACTDGALPLAGLIEVNGTLYGTTFAGGNYINDVGTFGTVFAVDPTTGAETVVYPFCSQGEDACTDGALPTASLIYVNGALYGTTLYGGAGGYGTAFALDPNTRAETVIYSFGSQKNEADGASPGAALIDIKGTLYGTTEVGGTHNPCVGGNPGCGTVFSIDPNTGIEKVLHSFFCQQNCADGWDPGPGLIEAKSVLYGTTFWGGGTGCDGHGCGTVFSIDRSTRGERVLYSFCSQQNCADGANPGSNLIDVNGKLYGTTSYGGVVGCGGSGCGTVFVLKKER